MSSVNTLSVYKHITAFSVFTYKLCFSPWQQATFSHTKLIFTHLIYMTSEREIHGYATSCFWFCGIQMSPVCSWDGPVERSVICCFNPMWWGMLNETGCVAIFKFFVLFVFVNSMPAYLDMLFCFFLILQFNSTYLPHPKKEKGQKRKRPKKPKLTDTKTHCHYWEIHCVQGSVHPRRCVQLYYLYLSSDFPGVYRL